MLRLWGRGPPRMGLPVLWGWLQLQGTPCVDASVCLRYVLPVASFSLHELVSIVSYITLACTNCWKQLTVSMLHSSLYHHVLPSIGTLKCAICNIIDWHTYVTGCSYLTRNGKYRYINILTSLSPSVSFRNDVNVMWKAINQELYYFLKEMQLSSHVKHSSRCTVVAACPEKNLHGLTEEMAQHFCNI
jgi:hypothetical protein